MRYVVEAVRAMPCTKARKKEKKTHLASAMRYVDEADRAMECTENSPCPHACMRLGFRL
jgi:hypothetical protein